MIFISWVLLFSSLSLAITPANSLILFDSRDYDTCKAQATKAREEYGQWALQIIPTLYASLDPRQSVKEFYFREMDQFQLATPKMAQELGKKLKECLTHAERMGMEIHLKFHLDDKAGKVWRNSLFFDPNKKYTQVSFSEAMIHPLFKNSKAAWDPFWVYLAGEMGTSLSQFPLSYLSLIDELQQLPHPPKIGLSLNFNQVLGAQGPPSAMHRYWVKKVFSKSQMLGYSHYLPIRGVLAPSSFQQGQEQFLKELSIYGIRWKKGPLVISEFGLGGGRPGGGPAQNAVEALAHPHLGVGYPYRQDQDPWQKPFLRSLRKKYYQSFSQALKLWPNLAQRVFLWSSDSWDVHGFSPWSQEYVDAEIIPIFNPDPEKVF